MSKTLAEQVQEQKLVAEEEKEDFFTFAIKKASVHRELTIRCKKKDVEEEVARYIRFLRFDTMEKIFQVGQIKPFGFKVDDAIADFNARRKREGNTEYMEYLQPINPTIEGTNSAIKKT